MRFWLLWCALAATACDTTTSTPEDFAVPQDLSVQNDVALSCSNSCSTCTTGTTCVTSAGGLTPFNGTCLASCTSEVDCTGGRACVAIFGASPNGRYCLSPTEPQSCGINCDLVEATSSCSGNEVVSPYATIVCGVKYMHCPNGCMEDAPDGGTNRQAHCK